MNNKLLAILSTVFKLKNAEIVPELTSEDVQKWDSLTQMDMVVSIEEAFSISLSIDDITRMNSVAEIITVVREHGVDVGD